MKTTRSLSPVVAGLLPILVCASGTRAAVNLAMVAKPSASYVSGDCSVSALNDASRHKNSRDRRAGAYGNWNHPGTQWVQYEWTRPVSTDKVDLYWW